MSDLTHATWRQLILLTGENITPDRLNTLLRSIKVEKLENLTEIQAQRLADALSPLPNLKEMLWQGILEAIESAQKDDKSLAKIDATALADVVLPYQMDKLAATLVASQQQHLILPDETPPPAGQA